MKAQYLLPGFIWSLEREPGKKAYLQKLDKEIKSHFSYVENKHNKQRGYYRKEFGKESALALYVSRYLGDGIYFSDDPKLLDMFTDMSNKLTLKSETVYLLVVNDGRVLEGTDIIVTRELFDFLINQTLAAKYSDLVVKEFTADDLFELNRTYISDIGSESKKSTIILGFILMIFLMFCGGGMAWFILMA